MDTIDDLFLTRRTWINAVLIRDDGCDCYFQATSWREFAHRVLESADGLWGRDGGGVVRVFGSESGRLREFTLHECRRVAATTAALP